MSGNIIIDGRLVKAYDRLRGLALDTFLMMADMVKDPDKYIKRLEAGSGMDRFYD